MSQPRAAQTRCRLIQAGAAEFARCGYAGTKLLTVATAADVSMGALTFHFPSKRNLSDTIRAHGKRTTRREVTSAAATAASATQSIVDITHCLARLLHDDATVRAARRLDAADWSETWLPRLHDLSTRAAVSGALRPGIAPGTLTMLATILVESGETYATCLAEGRTTTSLSARLTTLWDTILTAVASDTHRQELMAAGTTV
ncbi:TetR family transcriptional regulator [Streptomyces longisporoflavus]|uniref:TetR family transcriptional regulator n=1 Tax=Streptomyces longisporoflavus TaxID=28044 RepID=A0ABW7R3S0_9ACTN